MKGVEPMLGITVPSGWINYSISREGIIIVDLYPGSYSKSAHRFQH